VGEVIKEKEEGIGCGTPPGELVSLTVAEFAGIFGEGCEDLAG
jgi:hypothetical protein